MLNKKNENQNLDFIPDLLAKLTAYWHKEDKQFEQERIMPTSTVPELIFRLHWINGAIWYRENIARTEDVLAVFEAKRKIDRHNQLRNNLIEAIDEQIIKDQNPEAPYNSEGIGSILDRISVTVLKIYHLGEILRNKPQEGLETKLMAVRDQLMFLTEQLQILSEQIQSGQRRIRVFRQHKLYNDSRTNPFIATSIADDKEL